MTNRRNVITYGKSSRKQTGNLASIEAKGSSCSRYINDRGNWGGNLQDKKGIDAPAESFALQGHSDYKKRSHLAYPKKSRSIVRTSLTNMSASKGLTRICDLDLVHPVYNDQTLFQISLSDEDEDAKLNESGRMRRKRRNPADNSMFKESTLVYDDDSLQRHVAAEIHLDQIKYQKFGETTELKQPSELELHASNAPLAHLALMNTCKLSSSKPGHISATQDLEISGGTFTDQDENDACAFKDAKASGEKWLEVAPMNLGIRARQPWKSLALHRKATLMHDSPEPKSKHPSFKASSPTFSAVQKNTFASSDASRISTDGDTATNIRQAELWDMLLKDDAHQIRSISSEGSSFSTNDRDACEKKTLHRSRAQAPNRLTSTMSRKRPRLVDHLGSYCKSQYGIKKTSAEQNVGDNDDYKFDEDFQPSCRESPFFESSSNMNHWRPTSPLHDSIVPKAAQSAPIISTGGLKTTYARQRSYLTNDDCSQDTSFDIPVAGNIYGMKRGRGGVETTVPRHQNEAFDGDVNEVLNDPNCTMRSIHELREAGSNARLIGEMEAILDDVNEENDRSMSQRRSKLLELVVRLKEPLFCTLFIDQGLDLCLFAELDPGNDLIKGALYASAALQLLVPSMSIPRLSLISGSRMLGFLTKLLDEDQNLELAIKRRGIKMSNTTQLDFENLWLSLLESAPWTAGRPPVLTVRTLCLQCIEYFVRHARESGCIAAVFSHKLIERISRILKPDLSTLVRQHSLKFLVDLQLAVSVLESYTISDSDTDKGEIWTGNTLESVIDLLPLLKTWSEEKVGSLRTVILRLYLNLTNKSPALCKQFARPDVIGAILNIIVSHFQWLSEDATHNMELLLDNLILALGSMINLAECDFTRKLVSSLFSEDFGFLDTLLQVFITKQEKACEVSDFHTCL